MTTFLLIFFLFLINLSFWFIHVLQRLLYSLYLWQLKEYRLDRFFEEVSRNKRILFPKVSLLGLILLLLLYFFATFLLQRFLVILFYFLFGLYSLYLLVKRRWRFPEFTKKMLFLLAFVLFSLSIILLALGGFSLFLLLFEVLFPIFVLICVLLVQIPTFFVKKWIKSKAKKKREKFKDLIVVGITGSFGKSSTKEFLYELLCSKYNVLKTEGNVNTEMGVANTVLQKLKKEHQIFICEMGAYKRGEIRDICEIVKPKIGILTGINEQHLALFGSQENIVKAKFELIESLPKGGLAILNWDNSFISENVKGKIKDLEKSFKTIEYSVFGKKDVWVEDIKVEKEKIFFKVFSKDGDSASFEMNILGKQIISNILAALCCAKELGIDFKEAADTLKKTGYQMMRLKKGVNGLNIIDSTYSANPDGVISHLDYLKIWEGKKILVMPCLIELGKESSKVHRRIGREIGEVCDLAIITTKHNFDDLKEGALQKRMSKDKILFLQKPELILEKIKSFSEANDIVLLESRVPKKLIELLIE
jgi:UDP-N-acetylmuramoyl-tripeptide--D-alanyl-D-alanine ligase